MVKENIPSYIGRLKCGCIVSAVVDDPDSNHPEDTKQFLKEMIDDNLIIERVTVGFVREHGFEKCKKHQDSPMQMSLLGYPVITDLEMLSNELRVVDVRSQTAARIINIGSE